jgi:hypothetical protein
LTAPPVILALYPYLVIEADKSVAFAARSRSSNLVKTVLIVKSRDLKKCALPLAQHLRSCGWMMVSQDRRLHRCQPQILQINPPTSSLTHKKIEVLYIFADGDLLISFG